MSFSQVVEDGYEFFAKRQLVTLFSAPNYCGEFDNAGGMMSVDESLMCSFQVPRLYPCFSHQLSNKPEVEHFTGINTFQNAGAGAVISRFKSF